MSLDNCCVTLQEAADLARILVASENIKVVSVDLGPFSSEKLGYVGDHKLLTVDIKVGVKEVRKLTFFVKTVLPKCNDFERLVFLEESRFFRDVVPNLVGGCESWAPRCHLVKEDFIVLEDLRAQGFKTNSDILTIDQLKAAIISVAQFHASSLIFEKKLEKPLNEIFPDFAKEKVFINDNGLSWKWLETGIEVVEAVAENLGLDPKYASSAYHLMLEKIKPESGLKNVLCHSDLWSNNFMFKDEDGSIVCRLVDFQMIAYTSFAVDLVQLLYLNTTRDVRLKVERELIESYHTVLAKIVKESGVDYDETLSLQEVFDNVEKKRICGLVAAVQFFPIALLNKDLAEEYTKDPEEFQNYMYTSRKDFVVKAMQADGIYRFRLQEAVKELIDFMVTFESFQ